jgi:hypothetical protein
MTEADDRLAPLMQVALGSGRTPVGASPSLSCSNSGQAALSTPEALAAWVAIASISAGERQS